jgi:uncharacterized protein YihD (DUF1040 family)
MRPLPKGHEKVTYYDHLELRYLRWDYLVKVANPRESLLKSKDKIVKYAARRAYYKYMHEFSFMGMELEDVENIARVYTVSYLGLYSMDTNPEKKARFKKAFEEKEKRKADISDIEKKDNYSLIAFLEQRLLECAHVLRQYCKGEAGFTYYSVFYRVEGDQWPSDDELINSPKKYGWERLAWSDFTKIRDMFVTMASGYSIEIDGTIYRVAIPNTAIVNTTDNNDLASLVETPSNSPMTAEELMIDMEEKATRKVTVKGVTFNVSLAERLSNLIELYKQRPPEKQLRILELFVKWLYRRNGSQKEMQEEIDQVKRMIYNLKKRMANSKEKNEPKNY